MRCVLSLAACLLAQTAFAAEATVVKLDMKKGTITVQGKPVKHVLRKGEAATSGPMGAGGGFHVGGSSGRPEVAIKLPTQPVTYPLRRVIFAPKPADPLEPDVNAGDPVEVEALGKLFVVTLTARMDGFRRHELLKLDPEKRERIEEALRYKRAMSDPKVKSKPGKPAAEALAEAETFEAGIMRKLHREVDAQRAALENPPKPDSEATAAAVLNIAKALLADGKPATGRKKLEQVVADYPGTKAAAEAKQLLR